MATINLLILLEEWEQWEADLIADNNMWWPYADKDKISGKTYDKMIELQTKREQAIKHLKEPVLTCSKCQKLLSRCSCAF